MKLSKMLIFIDKLMSSYRLMLILLIAYIAALAAATFIENSTNTATARELIYNAGWFYLLQWILCLCFIFQMISRQLFKQRKISVIILHFAFLIILAGAFVTNQIGQEGVIHVREGETTNVMMTGGATAKQMMGAGANHQSMVQLPFSIKLNSFKVNRYPGSNSPSSFVSDVTINSGDRTFSQLIYMNNILKTDGYRLYQSSFDPDEKGTVLSVNNDRIGTSITYLGYILMLVGFIGILFQRQSRFAFLNRKLKELNQQKSLLLMLLLFISTAGHAADLQIGVPDQKHAERFGSLLIQTPEGRIEPINTYSSKLVRKLFRSNPYDNVTSDQILLGILSDPNQWNAVKMLKIKNAEVNELLNVSSSEVAFNDLFDAAGRYILQSKVQQAYEIPVKQRNAFDKEILKLDEKVNILYSLQHGQLLSILPLENDINHKWYSPGDDLSKFSGKDSLFASKIMFWYLEEVASATVSGDWGKADEVLSMVSTYQQAKGIKVLPAEAKVKAEILYNRIDFFSWASRLYLAFGLLLLFTSIYNLIRKNGVVTGFSRFVIGLVFAVFLFQTAGIAMRWYISERAPWTNAYESMVYVGWATLAAGFLFAHRSKLTLSLTAVLGGVILFVANLNWMDPEITPLVPVLQSYWLMIHVAVITGSYGFFGMSFLLGTMTLLLMLFRKNNNSDRLSIATEELRIINEMSLWIGLVFLSLGTFIGAIWANESWGRYWGWDPKETWALISMLVYTFVLHARFMPRLRGNYIFSVMSILALSSVLMTYFGVNYYLAGLHSYGSGETPPALRVIIWIYVVLIALIGLTGFKLNKDKKHVVKHEILS